jgi:hypothetical protein
MSAGTITANGHSDSTVVGSSTSYSPDSSSYIPILETMLNESMGALSPKIPFEGSDATKLAKLILNSMSTAGRVYHDMQHVFDISETMNKDPILVLAALFHDVIYYSIDKCFQVDQAKALEGVLQPLIDSSDPTSPLVLASSFEDEMIEVVVRLFGFEKNKPLPKLGTNEFLSAMIGVRVLSKWLQTCQLMQIAACIEATIPFRPTVDGKSPMDRLHDRLATVCPHKPDEWLVRTVRMAASTANCDMCSFDSTNRDFFLDSSWKLIPEARPTLLQEDCPLIEYYNECFALEGRTMFLKGSVSKIFQSFRQEPTDTEMAAKEAKTHENLNIMGQYARIRMLQLMVLVDFVRVIGEDPAKVPLRPLLHMAVQDWSKFTPTSTSDEETPTGDETETELSSEEVEVRNWLIHGRRASFSWDPAKSPLGGYLYDRLGPTGVDPAVEIGKNQKPESFELLKYLPEDVIKAIASSFEIVLPDQAEKCRQVPNKLDFIGL